ncbi:MAG: hypothetical protein E7666_04290 [Ruminococcaceae bacterium]|nr:hypothetical protein [Oscillospiraceae bacterium]
MKELLIFFAIFLIIGSVEWLFYRFNAREVNEKKQEVFLPKLYFYFGNAFLIFSCLPFYGIWLDTKNIFLDPVSWIFILGDFLMVAMIFAQINWRLIPQESTFIHRNLFHMEKIYSYDKITKVKTLKSGDTLIFLKGKISPFVIDKFAIGLDVFIQKYNHYKLQNKKS